MWQHRIPGYRRWVPRHVETFTPQSGVKIVIFATPTPKYIAKTICEFEVFRGEGTHASKQVTVWQPIDRKCQN